MIICLSLTATPPYNIKWKNKPENLYQYHDMKILDQTQTFSKVNITIGALNNLLLW